MKSDAVDSWARFAVIVTVILLDAALEEALIVRAELMMLIRWTRDVLRYDFRWIVQEKLRLLSRRQGRHQ